MNRSAMRRIRIIHVLDRLTTGGTELVVLKLVAGLDPDLFEHMICALRAGIPPQLPANARYITMASSAAAGKRFFVPAMFRLFARESPDVVHSRNWGAIESIAAACLARVPAVVHRKHGRDIRTTISCPGDAGSSAGSVSPGELRLHRNRGAEAVLRCATGKMAERMRVFSNGVDTRRLRHPILRRRGAVFGTVGALDIQLRAGLRRPLRSGEGPHNAVACSRARSLPWH